MQLTTDMLCNHQCTAMMSMRKQCTALTMDDVTNSRYTAEHPPLLHKHLMSAFVRVGLINAPAPPAVWLTHWCTNRAFETGLDTHTHTHGVLPSSTRLAKLT